MRRSFPPCLALALAMALPPAAQGAGGPPELGLPVRCLVGTDCFIQNHVDNDPGPGRLDHACGRLSYDGERGTDFRLRGYADMRRGVDVVAAADGVVARVRDGEPDRHLRETGRAALAGREAGNGVLVDHGDGWETQYNHLRRGSVSVKPGDPVRAGDRLGQVGLSGVTEFPHLDFSVRYRGAVIDPFVGPGGWQGCGGPRQPLWSRDAASALAYRPTGVLLAGFAPGKPDPEAARDGAYGATLPAGAPALVFWVDLFGAQAGDRQVMRITGPDGATLHEAATDLAASNVSWFAYAGVPRRGEGWAPGDYVGHYRLERAGTLVAEARATLQIRGTGR